VDLESKWSGEPSNRPVSIPAPKPSASAQPAAKATPAPSAAATPAATPKPEPPPLVPPRGPGYVSAARGVPKDEVLIDLSGAGEVPPALQPWWSEQERALISPAGTKTHTLLFGDPKWQDFDLSVDVVPLPRPQASSATKGGTKRGRFGFGFRHQEGAHFSLTLDADAPRGPKGYVLSSARAEERESKVAATAAAAFSKHERRRLRLRVAGSELQLWIDGKQALSWAPLERRSGQLALIAPGGFAFADLFVKRVSLPKPPKSPRSRRHRVRLLEALQTFAPQDLRAWRRHDSLQVVVRWTSDGRIVGVGERLIREKKLSLPGPKDRKVSFQKARQRYGDQVHDLRTVFERLPARRRSLLALSLPADFGKQTKIRQAVVDLAARRRGAALQCSSLESLAFARSVAPRLSLVWAVPGDLAKQWPRAEVAERVLAALSEKRVLPPVAVALSLRQLSRASVAGLQRRKVWVYGRVYSTLAGEAARACVDWRVDALLPSEPQVGARVAALLDPKRKR